MKEKSEDHVRVPDHRPLRVGSLAGILGDAADHLGLSRDEIVRRLFG
jgi:hypothetical protein